MAFNKEKVMDAARKFVEKNQLDKAVKEYLRIVQEDPKDVRVWLKIGDLYAKKGSKQDATETYLKVARFYQDQGFYLKAVAVYKQILKLDPRLVDVNLKLAAHGQPVVGPDGATDLVRVAHGLLANFDQKTRLLEDYRCPADQRIEQFLTGHFQDVLTGGQALRLPGRTLILDAHGLARTLSLPANGAVFQSDVVTSYRVQNGRMNANPPRGRPSQLQGRVSQGGRATGGRAGHGPPQGALERRTQVGVLLHFGSESSPSGGESSRWCIVNAQLFQICSKCVVSVGWNKCDHRNRYPWVRRCPMLHSTGAN